MWVITVYVKNDIEIFEFENEKEAKEVYKGIQGCKILSELICEPLSSL